LVITPDNIVSNPSYRNIRSWILLKFQIIASISLPTEMFQPHTGTQTTLLVLKKLADAHPDIETLSSIAKSQPIFMSVPKKVGHDHRGNLLPARDDSGAIVLERIETSRLVRKQDGTMEEEINIHHEQLADDQLPTVLDDFKDWFNENKGAL
jgi:type I restriction enzyme M protein